MEFTNTFTVPVEPARAFEVLTDLERVAPCMPGATLEEVEGDTYHGRVKVKVGPMSVTYKGTATVTEVNKEDLTAAIEASGTEARGAGTASANVRASLKEIDDGGTEVTVVTELAVTGKPAQFGRGVMADVGSKIIDKFSDCLASTLEAGEEPAAPAPAEAVAAPSEAAAGPPEATGTVEEAQAAPAGGEAAVTGAREAAEGQGRRRVEQVAPQQDALDLWEVAGGATIKRLLPVIAGLVVVVGVIWWWRGR